MCLFVSCEGPVTFSNFVDFVYDRSQGGQQEKVKESDEKHDEMKIRFEEDVMPKEEKREELGSRLLHWL